MRDEQLSMLLRRTSRLTLVLEGLRAAAFGVAVLIGVALLAVLIDAAFPLAVWGLLTVDAVLAALAAVAAAYVLLQVSRNLYRPFRAARFAEIRLGLADNRLINALQLDRSARSGDSRELVHKAVEKGESLARSVSSTEVADFGRLYRASAVTAAVLLIVAVSFAADPRLFGMVLPRYFDPHGDHPPYTRVEFDVRITPEPTYFGHPATITTRLGGPHEVSQANVVFSDGESRETLPMVRNADGEFVLPIDRAVESRAFYIATPQGRSRQFDFTVLRVPFFEGARVAYQFPSYTNWPESRHALDSRGIRGLVGTVVTVTAQGSLPLRAGLLELEPDNGESEAPQAAATVELVSRADDPTVVSGSFSLEFSGRYRLRLVGTDGAESIEQREGRLSAAPDRFPQVAVIEPGPHLLAVEGWRVPVLIQATDDIGLARMQLLTSVNGWGPWPTDLPMQLPQPNLARSHHEFRLDELGARAGDVISYYATVADSHPSGVQLSESPTHLIQVISQDEYLDFMRHQYRMDELIAEAEAYREQLANLKARREELLKELEPLLEKLERGEELSVEQQQQLEELQKKLKDFAQAAESLADAFRQRAAEPQLYDLEQPYQEMLQTLSKQLDEQKSNAEQAAEKLADASSGLQDNALRGEMCEACRRFAENSAPFDEETGRQLEAGQADLELVRKAENILGAAERLRAVIQEQRDLADRLAEFRGSQPISSAHQPRADRLADQQQRLRDELQSSIRQLEVAAENAGDDLPQMTADARRIGQTIRDSSAAADQQQAARHARGGRGPESHAAAESAAEKLEALLSEMCQPSGAAQELSNRLDGPLKLPKDALSRSLEQLAQGRQLPSLGGSPNTGPGGDRGMGTRFGASMAQMVVVGPHQPGGRETDLRQVYTGRRGEGRGAVHPAGGSGVAAESIDPAAQHARQTAAGNLRGVPVPYREQAEAYFRRIAEEQ